MHLFWGSQQAVAQSLLLHGSQQAVSWFLPFWDSRLAMGQLLPFWGSQQSVVQSAILGLSSLWFGSQRSGPLCRLWITFCHFGASHG